MIQPSSSSSVMCGIIGMSDRKLLLLNTGYKDEKILVWEFAARASTVCVLHFGIKANAIQIGQATWAIWAAIKKYNLSKQIVMISMMYNSDLIQVISHTWNYWNAYSRLREERLVMFWDRGEYKKISRLVLNMYCDHNI